jgi:hypothetical protein
MQTPSSPRKAEVRTFEEMSSSFAILQHSASGDGYNDLTPLLAIGRGRLWQDGRARPARNSTDTARPVGEPTLDNFRLEELPTPQPGPGQMLLRTLWLSLDP